MLKGQNWGSTVDLSHLSLVEELNKYPLRVRVSITFWSESSSTIHKEITKAFTLHSSPLVECQDQGRVIRWKILGIRDLWQHQSSTSPRGINLGTSKSNVLFSITLSKSCLWLKMQFFILFYFIFLLCVGFRKA